MGAVSSTCADQRCGLGCPQSRASAEWDAQSQGAEQGGQGAPTSFVRRHPVLTEGRECSTPTFNDSRSPREPESEAPEVTPSTSTGAETGSDSVSATKTSLVGWPGRDGAHPPPISAADRELARSLLDQSQFADLPELPTGWIYARSKSTWRVYYYNTLSGQTTFSAPGGDDDLPFGWSVAKSRTTGQTYYWHAATERSQFERPAACG